MHKFFLGERTTARKKDKQREERKKKREREKEKIHQPKKLKPSKVQNKSTNQIPHKPKQNPNK